MFSLGCHGNQLFHKKAENQLNQSVKNCKRVRQKNMEANKNPKIRTRERALLHRKQQNKLVR